MKRIMKYMKCEAVWKVTNDIKRALNERGMCVE